MQSDIRCLSSDWIDFLLLVCITGFYLLAVIKGRRLSASGIKVNEPNPPMCLASLLNRIIPTLRNYEIVTTAWPHKFHLLPAVLRVPLTDFIPLKMIGVLMWLAALGIYVWAQVSMGQNWRIGTITDAELVTCGAFRRSRHPIYLTFWLMAWGTAAIYPEPSFILLAIVSSWLIHRQMQLEEAFLTQHFGHSYVDYCRRTSRYFTF